MATMGCTRKADVMIYVTMETLMSSVAPFIVKVNFFMRRER